MLNHHTRMTSEKDIDKGLDVKGSVSAIFCRKCYVVFIPMVDSLHVSRISFQRVDLYLL